MTCFYVCESFMSVFCLFVSAFATEIQRQRTFPYILNNFICNFVFNNFQTSYIYSSWQPIQLTHWGVPLLINLDQVCWGSEPKTDFAPYNAPTNALYNVVTLIESFKETLSLDPLGLLANAVLLKKA